MRQIDATLKAELLELLALASLQTLPNGSRKLVAGYLAAMSELLDEASDPYVEAGETERSLARTPAQRAHAEAFGDISPYYIGGPDTSIAEIVESARRGDDADGG